MNEMTWVYKKTEPMLWTVGFFDPQGKWWTDGDYDNQQDAARRTHFLNGGSVKHPLECRCEQCMDEAFGPLAERAE